MIQFEFYDCVSVEFLWTFVACLFPDSLQYLFVSDDVAAVSLRLKWKPRVVRVTHSSLTCLRRRHQLHLLAVIIAVRLLSVLDHWVSNGLYVLVTLCAVLWRLYQRTLTHCWMNIHRILMWFKRLRNICWMDWTCIGIYSVSQKKNPPWGVLIFFIFFTNGGGFLIDFLHTCYTFSSTLDYKFLFNYHWFWQSYAILSATTQFT